MAVLLSHTKTSITHISLIWGSNIMIRRIGHSSNPLELCSNHFPVSFAGQGVLNRDPAVWLDGARHPLEQKYSMAVLQCHSTT